MGPALSFPNNRKLQAIFSISTLIIALILVGKKLDYKVIIFILYTVILIIWSVLVFGTDWIKDRHVYHSISALSFAIILQERKVSRVVFIIPLAIVAGFSFLSIIFFQESLLDGEFFKLNRNVFIRVILILSMALTVNDVFGYYSRPKLWPGLVGFIFGVLSQSRAGLGIAIMYLGVLVIFNIHGVIRSDIVLKKRVKNKRIYSLLVIVTFSLILIIMIVSISHSRFLIQGLNSPGRAKIYMSFFNELTMKNFITGFRPTIMQTFDHLHSSYLQLLALNGLGAIPVFIVLAYSIWYMFIKSKLLFLLLLILCVYSFVEHVFFFYLGDMVVSPIVFMAILQKNKETWVRY
jgi:hypothetical protein